MSDTIERVRPAHVLIEGPADYTGRLTDLTRGHQLPIALFSHARNGRSTRVTWTAFTDFSPEWVALEQAARVGAESRFIDLPAWHPDFDSETERYSAAAMTAMKRMGLDTVDAMWDHVVECRAQATTTSQMIDILNTYFDMVRAGGPAASAREKYMASWARSAQLRGGPVVVVCGGYHRPAIMAELTAGPPPSDAWPPVPVAEPSLDVGTYLIPYSYRRLRLEAPWWYEMLWRNGISAPQIAIEALVRSLRSQGHHVSTTDVIGFRTQALALAAMRGHSTPTRRDVLDAAAGSLIDQALTSPLPWTRAGEPDGVDPDPVITACVRTMRGDRRGALHPDSPAPGLVHHVDMLLEELDLVPGTVSLDLTDHRGRTRSRVLHQLRLLGIPGFGRTFGPTGGSDMLSAEQWVITQTDERDPALTEAAAHGHTLVEASSAQLESALRRGGSDVATVAELLFDAVLCGLDSMSDATALVAVESLHAAADLADVGLLARTSLDLWRHDFLFGSRGSTVLGAVVTAACSRVITLARRSRATPGGADIGRIEAMAVVADVMRHAARLLTDDPTTELALLAADHGAAVDMRGAALGTSWSRSTPASAAAAVRSIAPDRLGDWLCGLFGVARESFLHNGSGNAVLTAVDDVVSGLTEHDFLVALPALRQSFEFFPPRERSAVAARFVAASTASPVPESVEPGVLLDGRIDAQLDEIGLR
ncbi:DUF5682 family protein [Rhodococcus sp. 06-235-1A]|uniref:DUF5682 family protein n=1 Tax=Rhodococcus sp. 06-235-1A TaxID=2022508 RepID=UPI001C5288E1|nr:DUF5682 family protein [Rhodococcus sp. 06-235-1A]